MKVYWTNNGRWSWAWQLRAGRLIVTVGTARYPEYVKWRRILSNTFGLARWPRGGKLAFRFPRRTAFYVDVGVNHPSVTAAAKGGVR